MIVGQSRSVHMYINLLMCIIYCTYIESTREHQQYLFNLTCVYVYGLNVESIFFSVHSRTF